MGYRRRDARPRLALWMLVALGDVALLLVSAGLPVLFAMFGVVAVTVAGVATWRLTRRATVVREDALPARPVTRAW
ncbi:MULTISPECIES: hypothetical protein [unclassified Micromonospora]|uniref:hypothetical protein n=1 Tax=unclassified Micromonospora TaxID=2617518 RepID=UPI00098D7523|nr:MULTISPECIES: hypothetical protein [unclassified Micromonospora]MDI5937696.1 hypothetical protein [Micromonospora sp. DH15]OON32267.1 hypothetical protein BSA16_06590 [Micromonospora sp. Rc5]